MRQSGLRLRYGSDILPLPTRISLAKTASPSKIYENYFDKLAEIIKPKQKIYLNFDKRNFFLNASLPYFRKLKIFHRESSPIKIKSDLDNDRIYIYFKNQKIHSDLIFYYLALLPKYQKLGTQIFFSQKLKKLLLEKKKKIYNIPTGHYHFKRAFRKYQLDLAFETSGHFYMFKDLKTEAPYLALGMFLKIINKINLDELINLNKKLNLHRFIITNFPKNFASLLKEKFSLKLKRFDGYSFYNKEIYLHIRKSKTENKIRVYFEGDKKILTEIKKWLKKN